MFNVLGQEVQFSEFMNVQGTLEDKICLLRAKHSLRKPPHVNCSNVPGPDRSARGLSYYET